MIALFKNEMLKIVCRKNIIVFIVMIIGTICLYGHFNWKTTISCYQESSTANWKQSLIEDNENLKKNISEVPENIRSSITDIIMINDYRIQNNINPYKKSAWNFIYDSREIMIILKVIIIMIFTFIISSEFSNRTIKMLLIRPFKRWKILFAKYLSAIVVTICLLTVFIMTSSIVGIIIYGNLSDLMPLLKVQNGIVIEKSMLEQIGLAFFSRFIELLSIGTMSFMIASLVKNSSISNTISILLALLVGGISKFLEILGFKWTKYVFFSVMNLENNLTANNLTVLLLYLIAFILISMLFFSDKKKMI